VKREPELPTPPDQMLLGLSKLASALRIQHGVLAADRASLPSAGQADYEAYIHKNAPAARGH
jgi:hypothetical protein